MNELSESNKKGIKVWILTIMISIGFIIPFGLWTFGYFRSCSRNNINTYFKDLPEFINNISTFFATLMGLEIARSGIFNKGGTFWYPKKYGYWKLRKIFKNYNFVKSNKEYIELNDYINRINPSDNSFNSQYFNCVYVLQEISYDFRVVWNDYNYYSSIKKPSKHVHKLLNKIKQYIYLEVKKLNMEIEKKNNV